MSDLGDHFAAGRLNRDEFDDRADQAMQARFSTDLTPLFADLPASQPAAPTAPPGAVRAGGPPPWAYAMWLFPVLMVAAVAGAILLHAPFILWFGVWMLVIAKITGHKHRHRRQQQRSRWGQSTRASLRPGTVRRRCHGRAPSSARAASTESALSGSGGDQASRRT